MGTNCEQGCLLLSVSLWQGLSLSVALSLMMLQAKGLRSKRFMKNMLNDMRRAGKVTSKPARGKYFGYILPENYLALKERVNKSVPTEPNPPISRAAV